MREDSRIALLALWESDRFTLSEAIPYEHQLCPDGRPTGSWLETGFGDITGDLPEEDFWPGITTEDSLAKRLRPDFMKSAASLRLGS
jgi:hypothetical protein